MAEQKPEEPKKGDQDSNANKPQVPPIIGSGETPQSHSAQGKQENNANQLAEQIKHTDHIIAWSAGVTAFLTLVLAALAGLQAYSFIESERAVLILKDVRFTYGDPTTIDSNRDLAITIRNVGKHISRVGRIEFDPVYGVIKKSLPEILSEHPDIRERNTYISRLPPIPPDSDHTIFPAIKRSKPPVDDQIFINGLIDGSIPMWVFGEVEYEIGYPSWRGGGLGFCVKYMPPSLRPPISGLPSFVTCEYPQYTYIR